MDTGAFEPRLKELMHAFLEENKKLNLSALRTEELCWNGNILDSFAALDIPCLREPSGRLLDLGTGGGFPLLVLASCMPSWKFVGLDSIGKKIEAIKIIVQTLGLSNITLLSGRAEGIGRDRSHREQYDVVTARAVAPLNVLLEYAAPFVKVGGHILLWKSLSIEQELHESLLARAELSCQMEQPFTYTLGGDWGNRQILIFQKRFATKEMYPREVGIPKGNPLL